MNDVPSVSILVTYDGSTTGANDDGSNTPSAINFNGVNGNTGATGLGVDIEIDGVVKHSLP